MPLPLSTIHQASLLYALSIFLAGFILGCIRVPLIEPLIGPRCAQFLEMPLMFFIIRHAASVSVAELHRHVLLVSTQGGKKPFDGILPYAGVDKLSALLMGIWGLVQFLGLEVGFWVSVCYVRGDVNKGIWDWLGDMDPLIRGVFLGILGMVPLLPALEV